MTTATLALQTTVPAPALARPRLITRPLLLRFVSVIGSSVSFYLPLSVVPLYAKTSGSDTGAGLRNPALVRPALLFSASTMAAGVLVTFLPLALTAKSAALAMTALFIQPAASTVARWAAGRIGDRHGQARLLVPGVLLSAAGMAALAATHTPALVVGGAACFGIGFGALQNATLALMYARSPRGGYNAVSAIWNAGYDAGMGTGAIGIGLLVAHIGYPVAFLVTAALVIPALAPARREHSRSATRSRPAAAR